MQTRVSEILGIRYPVLQGAMASIADAPLAAAVSNAGGLGIIACGSASADWLRAQVALARTLTDRPIGVNIMLMSPAAPTLASAAAEMKIEVITTGAGDPGAYIAAWKQAGCKVVPVVASAALARRMQRLGADAVVAEGCEAGGHIGELSTMALVPAVCEAVSIPVIAAGGIADGRGMVAAFALGAEGVQLGTRFLTAYECGVSSAYKNKVIEAKDSDTIVTGRTTGHPVRCLKNKLTRAIRQSEQSGKESPEEMEARLAGSLRRAVEGDVDGGSLMAGQVACLIHDEKSAQEIIDELIEQAASWGDKTLAHMARANAARMWRADAASCATSSPSPGAPS